jgi:hypothetical protein
VKQIENKIDEKANKSSLLSAERKLRLSQSNVSNSKQKIDPPVTEQRNYAGRDSETKRSSFKHSEESMMSSESASKDQPKRKNDSSDSKDSLSKQHCSQDIRNKSYPGKFRGSENKSQWCTYNKELNNSFNTSSHYQNGDSSNRWSYLKNKDFDSNAENATKQNKSSNQQLSNVKYRDYTSNSNPASGGSISNSDEEEDESVSNFEIDDDNDSGSVADSESTNSEPDERSGKHRKRSIVQKLIDNAEEYKNVSGTEKIGKSKLKY